MSHYFSNKDSFKVINTDVQRSVAVYNDEAMAVKVKFTQPTTIPDLHQHQHQQITYVIAGNFTFWLEDEKIELTTGDVLLIEPNKQHGCVCHTANGELLDVFQPLREDFLL